MIAFKPRPSNRGFLLVVVVLTAHLIHALQFGPPTINTFEKRNPVTGNITRWQSRTLPATATELDFQSTDVQIGDLFWDFQCLPPQLFLESTLEGFTSWRRRLFINDVCVLENAK